MSWVSLLLLTAALLFRKFELPGAQWLWLVALTSLGVNWLSLRDKIRPVRIILVLLLLSLLALYLRFGIVSGLGRLASCFGLISLGITFAVKSFPGKGIDKVNVLLCFVLLGTGSALGDWKFFHYFRGKNMEDLLLARLSDDRLSDADNKIERLFPRSVADDVSSKEALDRAHAFEERRELGNALQAYDLAIYYNPYNALAYLARGSFKLNRLDLDFATAESAIRDFSRSIRLDSTISQSWYLRANALAYLNRRERVCGDALRAFQLDTGLRDGCLNLTLRICPDSSYLITGMPLHP